MAVEEDLSEPKRRGSAALMAMAWNIVAKKWQARSCPGAHRKGGNTLDDVGPEKEFVYQQYRKQGTSRGARLPQCTVGEIVPLAYDPGDPGRTVSVAGRGYERARNLLVLGGGLLWLGRWLRKKALERASR